MQTDSEVPDHYGSYYHQVTAEVYRAVQREAFGEDIGQNSWLTRLELDRFTEQLGVTPATLLLDVACGAGGPCISPG